MYCYNLYYMFSIVHMITIHDNILYLKLHSKNTHYKTKGYYRRIRPCKILASCINKHYNWKKHTSKVLPCLFIFVNFVRRHYII